MSHRVILIGPPGSGKTSIGRQVAKITNSVFTDTDHEIETKVGKSITNIFLEDGESFFREREKEIVIQTINDKTGVISLGGGSVLDSEVQKILENLKDEVVYLEVTISNAAPRVGFNKDRPLLAGNPRAKWQELMEVRRPIYERLAGRKVSTDNRKPNEVAAEIAKAVLA